MENQKIEPFYVTGISERTTNENGQALIDIPALWNKFMSEGILQQIPDKVENSIYCLYTDYESDHTKPYTTILGCKVNGLKNIPEGMVGKTVAAGNYNKRTVTGNLLQGLVYNEWLKIWNAALPRIYTTDFEVYGDKLLNPESAEVAIFIAVK